MSDLIKALRFQGRFGSETEDDARARRYRERCEAADRIEALEAKIAQLRATQPAPIPAQTSACPTCPKDTPYGPATCFNCVKDSEASAANALTDEAKDAARESATDHAMQRACRALPGGYSIRVELERGAGWVEWTGPTGDWHHIEGEGHLSDDINAAIDATIASHINAGQAEENESC